MMFNLKTERNEETNLSNAGFHLHSHLHIKFFCFHRRSNCRCSMGIYFLCSSNDREAIYS